MSIKSLASISCIFLEFLISKPSDYVLYKYFIYPMVPRSNDISSINYLI